MALTSEIHSGFSELRVISGNLAASYLVHPILSIMTVLGGSPVLPLPGTAQAHDGRAAYAPLASEDPSLNAADRSVIPLQRPLPTMSSFDLVYCKSASSIFPEICHVAWRAEDNCD